MKAFDKALVLLAMGALGVAAGGCGGATGVYVGVAVPGPYVGYPVGTVGGWVGPPPVVYYEEDAMIEPVDTGERLAKSKQEESSGSTDKASGE